MAPMNPRLLRPTGQFDPRRIAGLELWLDTSDESRLTLSGSAISQVRDKSGKGWVAEQSTGANQPTFTPNAINGRSAAVFNGSSTRMTIPSFASIEQFTAFAVCYRPWPTNAFKGIGSTGNYGATAGIGFFVQAQSASNGALAGDLQIFGDGFTTGRAPRSIGPLSSASLSSNQPAILSSILSPNASGLWVNGFNVGTRVNSTGTPSAPIGTLFFGAGFISPNVVDFWDGGIAEFLIYKAALSSAEIKRVERFLGAKYAITVTA
jgi:hypothetical protein